MASFYSDVRLHLDSGEEPLEVSASELVDTRSWVLRIDGSGGGVVIHPRILPAGDRHRAERLG
jgi:hypothetical protein